METGFYWVGSQHAAPQIWYYLLGYGVYRPMEPIPLSLERFSAAGFTFLSGKLIVPS